MLRRARFAVFASICLFVISSPSSGSPGRWEGREVRVAFGAWSAHALGRLWAAFVGVPRLPKSGVGADPHGACTTGPTPTCGQQQATAEEGTGADPLDGN